MPRVLLQALGRGSAGVQGLCPPYWKTSITPGILEQRRLLDPNDIEAGILTVGKGAQLSGLSSRQLRRVRSADREAGVTTLVHGNRRASSL